jgi:D-alanyl-D-alanine dipeptidase
MRLISPQGSQGHAALSPMHLRCACRGCRARLFDWATAAAAGEKPNRFVYLHDADATILQDMRYGSANNFTGHRVPGYDAPWSLAQGL